MSTSDPTPPATWYSCEITFASFLRITASTSLITSGRGLVHRRDPQRHLGLRLGRELSEHLGGERRVQVGDRQRHRLRRLAAQERADLLRRRAAQELERPHLDHGRQAAHHLGRARRADRLLEHVARVLEAAVADEVDRARRSPRPRPSRPRSCPRRPGASSPSRASAPRSPPRGGGRAARRRARARATRAARRPSGARSASRCLAAAASERPAPPTVIGPEPLTSSFIQARTWWATRSGSRSTSSSSSARTGFASGRRARGSAIVSS